MNKQIRWRQQGENFKEILRFTYFFFFLYKKEIYCDIIINVFDYEDIKK